MFLCLRLRAHYAAYEPTLRQLKQKYESAMKEKMLSRLERDRAVGQVQGLQATLKNLSTMSAGSADPLLGEATPFHPSSFINTLYIARSVKCIHYCQVIAK